MKLHFLARAEYSRTVKPPKFGGLQRPSSVCVILWCVISISELDLGSNGFFSMDFLPA